MLLLKISLSLFLFAVLIGNGVYEFRAPEKEKPATARRKASIWALIILPPILAFIALWCTG